jgi:hypothetical protein
LARTNEAIDDLAGRSALARQQALRLQSAADLIDGLPGLDAELARKLVVIKSGLLG